MDIMNLRTWIFFFLICFVALLWAAFLMTQGAMLWVSVTLITVVLGFNFFLIASEIREHKKRKELMKVVSEIPSPESV